MNTELMRTLIQSLAGNKIFSVDFIKRTTGEARTMTCRLGVKAGQTGEGLPFCPIEKRVLPVMDLQIAAELTKAGKCVSGAYRMINLDTVTEIRANGQVYKFGE